ncbi:MAG TPA: ribosome biogenesis GTPase Der [Vicinamibacterales bacterium]|nr:ribosome biogenesis GTPase Der [Vicinamibacterales bacterium]
MPLKRPGGVPTVVLVGRPNVGKSTLFNRITDTRRAIVAPVAGTTRDSIAQPAEWQRTNFSLVDTGGMFGASSDPLHELVVEHGRRAIATADLVVFVVDGREGLVSADEEIAGALRTVNAPVLIAVNKTDDRRARGRAVEFYSLGFEPIIEIAAEHGEGVGDLLDEIIARFPEGYRNVPIPAREPETKVAIVGRPNVGKSSLLNRLLKEERSIVSDMPGTTRDTVDAVLKWQKRTFRILDTAGIRRAGRVARTGQVESVSVLIARRAIAQADVAVLMVDATEGATDQDATIAGEAEKTGCGVIIAVNKWDLMKGRGQDFSKEFDDKLRQQVKFLDYAQILHISARTGERTPKLLETIDKVADSRMRRIPTAELNRFVQAVTSGHPPASPGRREVRILYAAQIGVAPPEFVFFTNIATTFHFSYERFLKNQLRQSFGLEGTPIRIQVRKRSR